MPTSPKTLTVYLKRRGRARKTDLTVPAQRPPGELTHEGKTYYWHLQDNVEGVVYYDEMRPVPA